MDEELHAEVSEIMNDTGNVSGNTKGNKASRRTSVAVCEKSSSTGEEPMRKKKRSSKSKEPCMSDTQKSSTVTIVRKSRVPHNSTAKDINKRNAKGETKLHVACIKVGNMLMYMDCWTSFI
jgi:hypothetical protein